MKDELNTDQVKDCFAKTLTRLRKQAGLSQEELANRSRLERAFVSRLERAVAQPSLLTLLKISNGLEVNPNDLIKEFLVDFDL